MNNFNTFARGIRKPRISLLSALRLNPPKYPRFPGAAKCNAVPAFCKGISAALRDSIKRDRLPKRISRSESIRTNRTGKHFSPENLKGCAA